MTQERIQQKQQCIAATVAVLGDKWSPLLIQALGEQAQRFCQMQDNLGINPRTLSARLQYLEEQGIVTKTVHKVMPPVSEYGLTAKGRDLLPIIDSMADWNHKYIH
jgi:DNA-binding HxlR family transcriptional regulator